MEFCVLGRIAVVRDGREIPLGSTREAALLADLLLHANRVVPTARLIDDLWGDDARPGAAATLHSHVRNLRHVVEPDRRSGVPCQVLVTRRPGYVLHVRPEQFDAWRAQ